MNLAELMAEADRLGKSSREDNHRRQVQRGLRVTSMYRRYLEETGGDAVAASVLALVEAVETCSFERT